MTEEALFHAYRHMGGYAAECVCGGVIEADLGTEAVIGEAVRIHNESTVHRQWAEWQRAVHDLQRPTRHPCPCHEARVG